MGLKVAAGYFLNFLYNDVITHIPVHFLRVSFLRLLNAKIDRSAKVLMHVRFLNPWKMIVGKNVVINQYCVFDTRRYPIVIGDNTDVGPYTRIWTLGHQPDSEEHALYGGPVTIGHHVWVASGVTILPGVDIGDGAVLAAAAVVHKSVPEMQIVAGNPAVFIRMRNNPLQYTLKYTPFFE